MDNRDYCPICLGAYLAPAEVYVSAGGFGVDCPACGAFEVADEAWEDLLDPNSRQGRELAPVDRARLSHRVHLAAGRKTVPKPKIMSDFVRHFIKDGCLGPAPSEQASNIIKFVGDHVNESGEKLKNFPDDFFVAVGSSKPDAAFEILFELIDRGLLVGVDTSSMSGKAAIDVGPTLSGWEVYEAEKRGKLSGKYGFIALKFGDAVLDPLMTDVVKPAVMNGIGYKLVDMRDVARAGVIDNIMRAQIRDSAFVIVDLTHDNAGAYWEAGYAEGLGKPVVYICERNKFDETRTHFDTNHCTTVIWSPDDYDSFAKELVATLRRSLNLFEDAG